MRSTFASGALVVALATRLAPADSMTLGALVADATNRLVRTLGDAAEAEAVRAALARVHHRLDAGEPPAVVAASLADAAGALDALARATSDRAAPVADVAALRHELSVAATLVRRSSDFDNA